MKFIKKKINIIKKMIFNLYTLDKMIKYEINYNYFEKKAMSSKEVGINKNIIREPKIIVSLTTYNKRIHDVFLTIESIFSQTLKADKIILWLSEDEFTNENIPLILKVMKLRGLEINYCKDLRSYKKIIPTLRQYPKDIIITIDDDILYPYDMIERLYNTHLENKEEVVFYMGHKILFDKDGTPKPYKKWEFSTKEIEKSLVTLPTGVGGVLYPPKVFDVEVLNEKAFMRLAPTADDIWLKAMTLKNNKYCLKVNENREFDTFFLGIKNGQDIALHHKNLGEDKNDIQLTTVFNEYNLWEKLKYEK